ncbi:hypothetical protein [Frigoriglobus tundricola]|uniref:Uncharacterized protein n=1 Tax=Frigoriglobus tundricola TaxID=2774151 RepID=A0A6M5Z516_9BACT|nr:hypothetical protein [Frigoriglobus tundricola]QJX00323.1 hypothetical protein FTUN_7949 [Frigoriglobus tundricola]
MRTLLLATVAGAAVALGFALAPRTAADAGTPDPLGAAPVPPAAPPRLVAHEWGTFTSFSGADGVPVGFTPNNTDLPNFVYDSTPRFSKGARLKHGGLVSMETPVIYFYADRDTRVSVKVDFPKGWITEWYPFAHGAPVRTEKNDKAGGQNIRWDVKLTPDEPAHFPRDRNDRENHYYHARETDAVGIQTEVAGGNAAEDANYDERGLRGGTVLQREKFLFYRGVGTFPPPVTVRALGGDKVRVVNGAGGKVTGLVLVTVRAGKTGFRPVGELESGATLDTQLPSDGTRAELGAFLVKELTAAGLYAKEAKAMVKTWDAAWFGEEGTRLLYLVPRAKTDELLPLTMEPKPTEVVRVLVGRHDFLTPEAEATAEKELQRVRTAQNELSAAYAQLQKLGRFNVQAQELAAKRLDTKTASAPQK